MVEFQILMITLIRKFSKHSHLRVFNLRLRSLCNLTTQEELNTPRRLQGPLLEGELEMREAMVTFLESPTLRLQ